MNLGLGGVLPQLPGWAMGCKESKDATDDPQKPSRPLPEKNVQWGIHDKRALFDDYELGEVLGEGGFGIVYSCKSRSDGTVYAVKMIDKSETKIEDIQRECTMLFKLAHPNIVRLYDVYYEKVFICMVLDILRGGDLIRGMMKIWDKKEMINTAKVVHICRQMTEGIAWLHEHGVAHRDIKGDNYLLDRPDIQDPACQVFLSDFGTVVNIKEGKRLKDQCGTKQYWSPEVWSADYGLKADIWALGITMFGMASGFFPFNGEKETRSREIKVPSAVPKICTNFVLACLNRDEAARVSADLALAQPYIKQDQTAPASPVVAAAADFAPQVKEPAKKHLNERRRELVERFEGTNNMPSAVDIADGMFEVKDRTGKSIKFEWQDAAEVNKKGILQFISLAKASSQGYQDDAQTSLDNIKKLLEDHKISTTPFGVGEAKSLEEFSNEMNSGAAQFLLDASQHKKLTRVVDVVVLRLVHGSGEDAKFLVQTGLMYADGRKGPAIMQLAGAKREAFENSLQTAMRLVNERISMSFVPIKWNLEKLEQFEEEEDSPSYPGVTTVYKKTIISGTVATSDRKVLDKIGLSDLGIWTSTDAKKDVRSFKWLTEAQCREQNVKLRYEKEGNSTDGISALVQASFGFDADSIATLLEDNGIDWRKFANGSSSVQDLANELSQGESTLQREKDGSLVRLVDVVILKITNKETGKLLVAHSALSTTNERLPGTKRRPYENHFATAKRILLNALKMDSNYVMLDTSDIRIVEEKTQSAKYPTLDTKYRRLIINATFTIDMSTFLKADGKLGTTKFSDEDAGRTQKKRELLDDYTLGKVVGEGGFGIVYLCTSKKTGGEYAVKMIDKVETPLEDIRKEAAWLFKLEHPSVVKLHDVYYEKVFICMVFDFYRGGDLIGGMTSIWKKDQTIPAARITHICRQMVEGIAWLHSKNVVHRDVKGDNYLMDRKDILDPKCSVFLADFGTVTDVPSGKRLKDHCGTKAYWSPEFWNYSYGLKVDIWAIGVVVYGMISGTFPFDGRKETEKKKLKLSTKAFVSGSIGFVTECLERDEAKRIDASQALVHEYIRSPASASPSNVAASESLEGLVPEVAEKARAGVNDRRRDLVEQLEEKKGQKGIKKCEDGSFQVEARGGKVTKFEWWTNEEIEMKGVLDFMANAKLCLQDPGINPLDLSTVKVLLEDYGISTDAFGLGRARTLEEFHTEVRSGASQWMLDASRHKTLVRVVEVVLLRIAYGNGPNAVFLIQSKSSSSHKDQLFGSKKMPFENTLQAASRVMSERLGSLDIPIRWDTTKPQQFEEREDSPSYPGVTTLYKKTIISGIVATSDISVLRRLGLGDEVLSTQPGFKWMTDEQCAKAGIKLWPPTNALADSTFLIQATFGFDAESMQAHLDKNGIELATLLGKSADASVSSRKLDALADELSKGEAKLEKQADGSIVRAVDVVALRLRSHETGKTLFEHSETFEGKAVTLNRLPATKQKAYENAFLAARRLLERNLKIDPDTIIFHSDEIYLTEETAPSLTFPGMLTKYRRRVINATMTQDMISLFTKSQESSIPSSHSGVAAERIPEDRRSSRVPESATMSSITVPGEKGRRSIKETE